MLESGTRGEREKVGSEKIKFTPPSGRLFYSTGKLEPEVVVKWAAVPATIVGKQITEDGIKQVVLDAAIRHRDPVVKKFHILDMPYLVPEAFRHDDDPSKVYVVIPGGHFGALRVNGRWEHASLMEGTLEESYREIKGAAEVEALLKDARTSLSD